MKISERRRKKRKKEKKSNWKLHSTQHVTIQTPSK